MNKPRVIFFGNGPLADATLKILEPSADIIFHARKKEDLETVAKLKRENPDAFGVLASFGVLIKENLLDLFEPTGGILNIHPSLLPKYRGPSPIETAILNGDKEFGVSIMKLAKEMDAGPIYYQTTFTPEAGDIEKSELYEKLAGLGAAWLAENLTNLPEPKSQDDKNATYTKKLDTTMSLLNPTEKSAKDLLDEIRAFANFPKSRYAFSGIDCIIHKAHVVNDAADNPLALKCADGDYLVIDELQPAGKRRMDAKSFINGYLR